MPATREAIAAALQFDADGLTHEVTQEHADAYNAIGATLKAEIEANQLSPDEAFNLMMDAMENSLDNALKYFRDDARKYKAVN